MRLPKDTAPIALSLFVGTMHVGCSAAPTPDETSLSGSTTTSSQTQTSDGGTGVRFDFGPAVELPSHFAQQAWEIECGQDVEKPYWRTGGWRHSRSVIDLLDTSVPLHNPVVLRPEP